MMEETDIKSMYPDELKKITDELGERSFRADQIFSWLHEKQAETYDDMTNIPAALRGKLADEYPITVLRVLKSVVSKKDQTEKYLFALKDGNAVESVLMRYVYGNTVCVSSQVGCAMGCVFCASASGGKIRSLKASEMLEQVYKIKRLSKERVSHVVVMGTGEPFDNYGSLIRFIRLVSDAKGMNLSARNITVSTCGLIPGIYALAKEKLPVTLAVSLHAPNDEKRRRMMPVANRYSVAEIAKAAKNYYETTGRRVTFEYALAAGVNDSLKDANELAKLCEGFDCHVNLIPMNPVREKMFRQTSREQTVIFQNKLEKHGIHVTIRRELGRDIDGACGQLMNRYAAEPGV